jgi:putative membrane protein
MLQQYSNKSINLLIAFVSIVIPILIISLLKITPPSFSEGLHLNFFPKLNAFINSGTTFCLIIGFYFIKIKNRRAHRIAMLSAFLLSVLFLLSYVIYHTLKEEDSKFGGIGFIRYVYFFILISHILLSAIVLPIVLRTFAFALQGNFIQHKKWAKFTFPLWLYVAISGVLVYVFMAPYY